MRIYKFDNIQEFIYKAAQVKAPFNSSNDRGANYDSQDYEEAVKKATKGRRISTRPTEINGAAIAQAGTIEAAPSVAGAFVNIGAYLTGDPQNMYAYNITEQPTPTKILNIEIDCGVGYKIKSEAIKKAGKKLLNAITSLEAAGYSIGVKCSIYITDKGLRKNNKFSFQIQAKEPGQPLNPSTFYSLISTDFIRRFYLRFAETLLTRKSKYFLNGYGRVLDSESPLKIKSMINQSSEEIIEIILNSNKK